MTSDPEISELITGAKVELNCDIENLSQSFPSQPTLHETEVQAIENELQKLHHKQVISKCTPEKGQLLSPVFTRPKKDGSHRMILNLKCLNREVTYHHFKIDTLQTALRLITQDCFMASIDLKNACYSVPIHPKHRKLFRFSCKGHVWQYDCLPNGIAMTTRKFTKLLKLVFAWLRKKGHISTSFLDDSLLSAYNEHVCECNVLDTANCFDHWGFIFI